MSTTVPANVATTAHARLSRWQWALVAFGVWTFLCFASVAQIAIVLTQRGEPVQWAQLTAQRSIDWYTCALFTPVFVWLVRRFPLRETHWSRAVPVYLLVTSACVVLKYALMVAIVRAVGGAPANMTLGRVLAQNGFLELVIFAGVIAVMHALALQQTLAQREQVALALRAQLSEAELELLKGQLQPHFLFNTLNGVASLIHTAPATADFIVVQLADLLRASLGHTGMREIPLSDELALLDTYLAIMEARFLGRISIDRDIDPETLGVLVPQFLLQPLVENAFEHGIGRRAAGGRIRIRSVMIDRARLRLEVSDDGAGLPHEQPVGEGVGLGNTRMRLARLHGDAQSLSLSPLRDGGTLVAVELPVRHA